MKGLSKSEENFYEVQTQSSLIKAKIVSQYFPQYCKILLKKKQKEIWFLDLFSGPGKYKDGNDSTPLLVASICANDKALKPKVRLLFNDKHFIGELKTNFENQFPKNTFDLAPRFADKTIGEDEAIKRFLEKDLPTPNPHPTLLFFDPWGYKGIDSKVLAKFLLGWGNEIFLFVNIKRIHAAIENDKFDELMTSLFPTRIDQLRKDRKYEATVYDRLNLIMENLAGEFVDSVNGKLYHCSFNFKRRTARQLATL
jgi:three-Cys-motif partner protein